MKKEWINPEISNLNVVNTKEGFGEEVVAEYKRPQQNYKCRYCNRVFNNQSARNNHELTCIQKPASEGLGDNPVELPGLDVELLS